MIAIVNFAEELRVIFGSAPAFVQKMLSVSPYIVGVAIGAACIRWALVPLVRASKGN